MQNNVYSQLSNDTIQAFYIIHVLSFLDLRINKNKNKEYHGSGAALLNSNLRNMI